jgi:hypothetical protein
LYVIPMAYYWIAKNTGSPQAVSNQLEREQALSDQQTQGEANQ